MNLYEASPVLSQFERLPPHDIEAEMCSLAAMMLNRECIPVVIGIIGEKEAFFQVDHQIIYERLVDMWKRDTAIDPILLRAELQRLQQLEEVGGTAYLSQMINTVPSAAHGMHYASIVRDKYLLRKLIVACNDGLRSAYAPYQVAQDVVNDAAGQFLKLSQAAAKADTLVAADVVGDEYMREIAGEVAPEPVYPTGWFDIDAKMDGGLRAGQLVVIGARPSVGKTAFAGETVIKMATAERPVPGMVFSLEMSRRELWQRMLASRSEVPFTKVRRNLYTPEEREKVIQHNAMLMQAPLWIDDNASVSVMDIIAKVRSTVFEHGVKIVWIDYLQLMNIPKDAERRDIAIGEVTRALKILSRSANVCICLLSQLNRGSEKEQREPRKSDLRESGNIEQDADVIWLLHRDNADDKGPHDSILKVIVEKQRNGPTGPVDLVWDGERMKPRNISRIGGFQ